MADLDVIGQRDIFDLDTKAMISVKFRRECRDAYSWVSHLPKSLISWPILETSLGRV